MRFSCLALVLLLAAPLGAEPLWSGVFAPYPGARRACAYRAYDHVVIAMQPPPDEPYTETTYYTTRDLPAKVETYYRLHHDGAELVTDGSALLAAKGGWPTLAVLPSARLRELCQARAKPGERTVVAVAERSRTR